MFYRDVMQKYRPVYAPDEPASAGGATEAVAAEAGADGQAAPASAAGPTAEPAAAASGAPAPADAAPAPAAEAPKAEPSLLEAAEIKSPEPAKAEGDATNEPAPADAAKSDGDKPKDETVKDAKADDKPKAEDDKSAADTDPARKDATAEAQPPAPIKYDAFKVPDGIKLDDQRLGAFTEVAGKGQVPQEVAQSLLDLHVAEMQRFADETARQVQQNQIDVWTKLNDIWKTEARSDPQIGGARLETALSRGKALIEEYGGTPEQVRDLLAHTTHNGMGNYPGFLRLLDNIAEALNVYEDLAVGNNAGPPKPQRTAGNRGWYKDMPGAGNGA